MFFFTGIGQGRPIPLSHSALLLHTPRPPPYPIFSSRNETNSRPLSPSREIERPPTRLPLPLGYANHRLDEPPFFSSFSLSFCDSLAFSLLSLHYINRYESPCNGLVVANLSGNDREKQSSAGTRGNPQPNRRFSMRLRPRLRLLFAKLKRISLRGLIQDTIFMLKKNSRKITLFTVVSLTMGSISCFLLPKFIAVPMSKVVAYSDLISNLQSRKVLTVLFEESSRRILYNTVTDSQDSSKPEEVVPLAIVRNQESSSVKSNYYPVSSSSNWSSSSIPKWQYVTRNIDHDENFLLGLMRETGTTYSYATQSAFVSMRNILVTIISLWMPLTPLIWLLYCQLSSANSHAKKRRPSN